MDIIKWQGSEKIKGKILIKAKGKMIYEFINTKNKMVGFLEAICSARAAAVSLLSAFSGTLLGIIPDSIKMSVPFVSILPLNVDMALQRLAWTIAIIAGLVAIINGSRAWFCKKEVKL